MRLVYVIVALLAVLVGATGIRANAAATLSAGVSLKSGQYTPAVGTNDRHVRSQLLAREDAIRVAQANTLDWQVTTGSPSVAPFKWTGLLARRIDDKQSSLCTAQFIKSNILLTAGHCLVDLTSGLPLAAIDPSKITFLLQYQEGLASQTFNAVCAGANPQWTLPSNYNSMSDSDKEAAQYVAIQHDFGMILVDGTSLTGAMEYALDWKGKYTFAVRVGYPRDILNDQIIQKAPGIVFFANEIPLWKGWNLANSVVQWGPVTDATFGMSGGAWVAHLSTTEGPNKNILIAVTSGGPPYRNTDSPAFPGGTWAAYLTAAEFNPLLEFVANGCK
jgi:hypothetical protein